MLSFREPLLLIPSLLGFLAAAASAFFHSYASFLQCFARSSLLLVTPSPANCSCKCFYASPSSSSCCDADVVEEEEQEDEALRKEEVEEIMARIGLPAAGGVGMGQADAAKLFDAEEPSFAEVQRAFGVLDADADGFIGAADLRGALAKLGCHEDAAACRAMIAAAGCVDGRMSMFQFVAFLEAGLC